MKSEGLITHKIPAKKKITLGDLAIMLKRQFDFMEEKMATKDGIKYLDSRIDNVDRRLDSIERRFNVIEDVVLNDHRLRIQALEKEIGIW
jgi:hypothetical protein